MFGKMCNTKRNNIKIMIYKYIYVLSNVHIDGKNCVKPSSVLKSF